MKVTKFIKKYKESTLKTEYAFIELENDTFEEFLELSDFIDNCHFELSVRINKEKLITISQHYVDCNELDVDYTEVGNLEKGTCFLINLDNRDVFMIDTLQNAIERATLLNKHAYIEIIGQ